MALKPVSDPNLLATLNAPEAAAPAGPKPVTDPALLAQLNGPQDIADTIPGSPEEAAAIAANPKPPAAEEPSVWEKFKSNLAEDPILGMWGHGLSTVAQGAPEVAMNAFGNTGVLAAAGLTAPFVSNDAEDSANFIKDFSHENMRAPQGESAKELTGALGEAFEPLQNIKSKLGDTTLEATGSPELATAADMLPDLGAALLGGEGAAAGTADLSKQALKADRVVNPKVGDLRAADIRLRPSDVRAMTPGAKKVPGEFRERFADAPELKKDTTLHNQQRMTDVAAKDIGTKDITDKSLDAAEKPHIAKYQLAEDVIGELPKERAVPEFVTAYREAVDSAKLPKGEDSGVTRVIGALRRRAATRARSNDVKTEEAGYADADMADRLEEQFGKQLEAAGEPQLLQQYRDARQALAKIHDVRMTTRADQIDASKLYQLNQKSEGRRLTGGLKLIADASEYAPNVTGHSLKTAARAGGEVEGSKAGLIKSGIKKVVRSIPGMDVGAEGFQRSLGLPDEARTSYYGRDPDIAPPREPQQSGLDLREVLELQPPPGVSRPMVNGAPQDTAFDLSQVLGLSEPLGVRPEATANNLSEVLGLSEPLVKPSNEVGVALPNFMRKKRKP